jgi:hypothetical protein
MMKPGACAGSGIYTVAMTSGMEGWPLTATHLLELLADDAPAFSAEPASSSEVTLLSLSASAPVALPLVVSSSEDDEEEASATEGLATSEAGAAGVSDSALDEAEDDSGAGAARIFLCLTERGLSFFSAFFERG